MVKRVQAAQVEGEDVKKDQKEDESFWPPFAGRHLPKEVVAAVEQANYPWAEEEGVGEGEGVQGAVDEVN